jgi:phytoene desaturase
VLNWYVGFNRRLPFFEHHTFFFDSDWDTHFRAVYEVPEWVDRPLFYLHVPSRTEASCAPEGGETVFILIPTAAGLREDEALRERYFGAVMTRMENLTGESLRDHVVTRHSYSIRDYETDYHAFKGNAFGLGQTLSQTAYFRTPNTSKKLKNLYYAGQYTVPGTGTTMSMISGKVVSERILREMG